MGCGCGKKKVVPQEVKPESLVQPQKQDAQVKDVTGYHIKKATK